MAPDDQPQPLQPQALDLPPDLDDFDAWAAEQRTEGPSFEFKLGGRWWHVRQPEEVPFDIVAAVTGGGAVRVNVDEFFQSVLYADEVDDFMAMKKRPDTPLSLRVAQPLIQRITEEMLGGRPTGRSERRAAGRKRTGGASRAGSSSRGTRKAPAR